MAKLVTITRKIQLRVVEPDLDKKRAVFKTLYDWNEQVFRAANKAVSHMYWMRNQSEFAYLSEGAKLKFADVNKIDTETGELLNPEGLLNGSKQNATYQVISAFLKAMKEQLSFFETKMPSDIYSNLNAQLYGVFNSKEEQRKLFSGEQSVRSYKRGMPMPISAKCITNIKLDEEKRDYIFTLYGIEFKTYFGAEWKVKDVNLRKKTMFEKSLEQAGDEFKITKEGEYKLCNSSIQLEGSKIFLNAVFQFETHRNVLKEDNVMEASLSVKVPILLNFNGNQIQVGSREGFLYPRLGIQKALRKVQIDSRFTKGGKGRKRKTKSIDRFKDSEKNYIGTKHHQYSEKVVQLCLENKCSKLVLKYLEERKPGEDLNRQEKAKWFEENEFLLRNWTYYGLTEKFKYKCHREGIMLIVEENPNKEVLE